MVLFSDSIAPDSHYRHKKRTDRIVEKVLMRHGSLIGNM